MKKTVISRRYLGVVFIVLAMAIIPAAAMADLILPVDTFINATQPVGSPPWVTATFHDVSLGVVDLTLTVNNLINREHVGHWYFNVTDETQLGFLNFALTSPAVSDPNTINKVANGFSVPTTGSFDIQIFFFDEFLGAATASGYNHPGETSYTSMTYRITGTGGFNPSVSFFDVFDTSGTWKTVAHIEDIDPNWPDLKNDSGYDAGGAAVPEPATMFLLGSGLIGLAGFARKKFRK